jgi:hypothetical protein
MLSSASHSIQAENIYKFFSKQFFPLWHFGPILGHEALQLPLFEVPYSVGRLWISDQPERPLTDNTHHSHKMDYHVAGRIHTHNPSKRAATLVHVASGICLLKTIAKGTT